MTALVSLWTQVRRQLEAAGVETPVFDARLLLEAGAGVKRLDILTDPRRELSETQVSAVEALAARRAEREPVSQILGRKEFWTFELAVSSSVLTPRPETELVVQAGLDMLGPDKPARVLDLGVGSGAILLAILSERPQARGLGVDASAAALAIARQNSENLKLADRVEWRNAEWDAGLEGPFDLIVSNPPYIPSADIEGLQPEVARYEPRLALDGGVDGLDAYRAILPALPRLLRPGGGFALEVGAGQSEDVMALARAAGMHAVEARRDLAGIERVIAGRVD